MINDFNETMKQLLLQKAGLDSNVVDINFDMPNREWSGAVTRPTVNIYLYDVRENRELREMYWDDETSHGKITSKRRPLRIDLFYMVTCWTSVIEDQNRLLWRVMETFFQYSPVPEDILQGDLVNLVHPLRTQIAQTDTGLKNLADFWGALENSLRPGINLVATVELDLNQQIVAPLVFARAFKFGLPVFYKDVAGNTYSMGHLAEGWESTPVRVGGYVQDSENNRLAGAAVRLIGLRDKGNPIQVGPTIRTDQKGQYVFSSVPPGDYTLVIEVAGRAPTQRSITVAVKEAGETVPELTYEITV